MSEDQEKIADEITGLAKAVTTAYVTYINEHRRIDNASVVAAMALLMAIVTDTLSYDDDDPSEDETLSLLTDTTKEVLKSKPLIREFMGMIIKNVVRGGT
jgi:nanoRNase/pAp phosphatase (c-di-AMP/oligoRNAs hydrolase)